MCAHDLECILKWDVIGICETWALVQPQLPVLSTYYDIVFSPAIKDRQRGRAEGGLMILIKKELKYVTLCITNLWIFVRVTCRNGMEITLGNVYISRRYCNEEAINLLRNVLNDNNDQFNSSMLVGGDFNGRIVDQNYMESEVAEDCGLLSLRTSMDQVLNRRGEMLLECIYFGFVALNGRTKGDIPGQFTFISKAGKSTVDLIWCQIELCKWVLELGVSDSILTSDHLPVSLYLDIEGGNVINVKNETTPAVKIRKYRWPKCEEKVNLFTQCINLKSPASAEPSGFYDTLRENIDNVVCHLGMVKEVTIYKGSYNKKPWYNSECRSLRFMFRKHHRKWRVDHKDEDMLLYLQYKKQYFNLCVTLRSAHENSFKEKLANLKQPGDFWKAVKSFRPKKENKCKQVPMQAWYDYLQKIYPTEHQESTYSQYLFIDVLRDPMIK